MWLINRNLTSTYQNVKDHKISIAIDNKYIERSLVRPFSLIFMAYELDRLFPLSLSLSLLF